MTQSDADIPAKGTGPLVITTGGTIGADPYPNPEKPPKDCTMPFGRDLVGEWFTENIQDVEVVTMEHLDSKMIDDGYRTRMLAIANSSKKNAVIISHGTDTITDTADFIALNGNAAKTIIIVGAMTPLSNGKESDGYANLAKALEVAAKKQKGLFIVLSDWDETGRWTPRAYPHAPGAWRKHYDDDGRRCRLMPT
jgi:L-asparaginase